MPPWRAVRLDHDFVGAVPRGKVPGTIPGTTAYLVGTELFAVASMIVCANSARA